MGCCRRVTLEYQIVDADAKGIGTSVVCGMAQKVERLVAHFHVFFVTFGWLYTFTFSLFRSSRIYFLHALVSSLCSGSARVWRSLNGNAQIHYAFKASRCHRFHSQLEQHHLSGGRGRGHCCFCSNQPPLAGKPDTLGKSIHIPRGKRPRAHASRPKP